MTTELTVPAFSKLFKLLALLIVAASGSWMYQLWSTGRLAPNASFSPANGLIWLLCGLVLMVFTVASIYRSKTTLTESSLKQTWLWDKEVMLAELVYAKLIRVRGFDWLIAPRLYVRTMMGKFTVFYASSPAMITEFERLVQKTQLGAQH
jgi:hypothetical protein